VIYVVIVEKKTKKIRIMSKIEFNPRKRKHIDYLHTIIMELHSEIFNTAFVLVANPYTITANDLRLELKTKIFLYKKYSRRLKILEL
jgi:TRAP-type mannitol/chloroaromatic compound transport system permease small subunit